MNRADFGDEVFQHCQSAEQPHAQPPSAPPSVPSTPGSSTADGVYAFWIFAWVLLCLWLWS